MNILWGYSPETSPEVPTFRDEIKTLRTEDSSLFLSLSLHSCLCPLGVSLHACVYKVVKNIDNLINYIQCFNISNHDIIPCHKFNTFFRPKDFIFSECIAK